MYVLHFFPLKCYGIIELYFILAVHCTFIFTGQMALCITSVPWETAASWSTFPYQTVGKTVLCSACQSGKHLLVCSELKAGVSLFSPWLLLQVHRWRLVCWQPKIDCVLFFSSRRAKTMIVCQLLTWWFVLLPGNWHGAVITRFSVPWNMCRCSYEV